jgi:hypothetical protein
MIRSLSKLALQVGRLALRQRTTTLAPCNTGATFFANPTRTRMQRRDPKSAGVGSSSRPEGRAGEAATTLRVTTLPPARSSNTARFPDSRTA